MTIVCAMGIFCGGGKWKNEYLNKQNTYSIMVQNIVRLASDSCPCLIRAIPVICRGIEMFRYILKLLIIMLTVLFIYLPVRRPWREKSVRGWVEAGFAAFMAGLLALALQGQYQTPAAMVRSAAGRIESGAGINLVPFRTIAGFFRLFSLDAFLVNIVGNIVMFIPWGFGLVLLWKRKQKVLSVVLHSLALPVFIETCQLFIGRSVDVDDLILNFAGGCLGAVLYLVVRKLAPGVVKLAR